MQEQGHREAIRYQPLTLQNADCICTAARRTARAVTQLYDLVLAPVALKASQFVILQAIHSHGEIAQHRLAQEYAVSVETLSRRLGTMRRAGWLQMKVCSKNREHVYSLSDLGERIYNEAVPHWVRAQIRLADALSSQEQLSSAVEALNLLAQAATQAQYLRKQNNGKKNSSDQEPEADCVFS